MPRTWRCQLPNSLDDKPSCFVGDILQRNLVDFNDLDIVSLRTTGHSDFHCSAFGVFDNVPLIPVRQNFNNVNLPCNLGNGSTYCIGRVVVWWTYACRNAIQSVHLDDRATTNKEQCDGQV